MPSSPTISSGIDDEGTARREAHGKTNKLYVENSGLINKQMHTCTRVQFKANLAGKHVLTSCHG
jgi:hypothetical protein